MKYIYPAIITKGKDMYEVSFLDFDITCRSDNLDDAMSGAGWTLWQHIEKLKETNLPKASSPFDMKCLKENQCVSIIEVDMAECRRKYDNKAIKKTLTIPNWLNTKAEEASLNFSHILQKALKAELNIKD